MLSSSRTIQNAFHHRILGQTRRCASSGGRPPLPPMPRLLPNTSFSTAVTTGGGWRHWWSRGNILIGMGWTGLAILAVDQYLQYEQRHMDASSHDMIQAIAEEAGRRRLALQEEWKDAPALYRVQVSRQYKSMGGSHGLEGLQVGNVLDVLEEHVGVGQDRKYHLCRKVDGGQIGWYPMGFVERVEEKSRWGWLSGTRTTDKH